MIDLETKNNLKCTVLYFSFLWNQIRGYNYVLFILIILKETTKKLVHWEVPAASGGAFGAGLGLLTGIAYFSLISVAAYTSLAALAAVMAIKVYSFVMVFMKKVNDKTNQTSPSSFLKTLNINNSKLKF